MWNNIMMDTRVSKLPEICFRILLCLFGVLGNCTLLFYSLPTISCKIEPYKILLINLALSDLMTNCLVDIPGILVEMYGTWFLGNSYCKIFWFTANLCMTSSILTTLTISISWFQKLVGSRPINCKIIRAAELRLLSILVILTWLVSVVFSIPLLYVCSIYMLKNEDKNQDQQPADKIFGCHDVFPSSLHKSIYQIFYLVLANALPILVMFSINIRIIIFLIRNRNRIAALKCAKRKVCPAPICSLPSNGDRLKNKHQDSKGQRGQIPEITVVEVSCVSSKTTELEVVNMETQSNSEGAVKVIISNVERGKIIQQYLHSLDEDKTKKTPASIIYNPCMFSYQEKIESTVLYSLKESQLGRNPEIDKSFPDRHIDHPERYSSLEKYSAEFTCSQVQCVGGNTKVPLTAGLACTDNKNSKDQLVAKTTAKNLFATTQIRAMTSIMAVAGVFLIFWVTHLAIRIKENTNSSEHIIDTANLITASYTTVIPYIFIYSMRKCPCSY